jgi:hypothetical protein
MFDDRRNYGERRNRITRDNTPLAGCRRHSGERRHLLRQYHPQPWWLQANYVEELQPPVLAHQFLRKQHRSRIETNLNGFRASAPEKTSSN